MRTCAGEIEGRPSYKLPYGTGNQQSLNEITHISGNAPVALMRLARE